jgi:hypothetical protein
VRQRFAAHRFPASRRAVGVVGDFTKSFVSHSFCVVDRAPEPVSGAKAAGDRLRKFNVSCPPLRSLLRSRSQRTRWVVLG